MGSARAVWGPLHPLQAAPWALLLLLQVLPCLIPDAAVGVAAEQRVALTEAAVAVPAGVGLSTSGDSDNLFNALPDYTASRERYVRVPRAKKGGEVAALVQWVLGFALILIFVAVAMVLVSLYSHIHFQRSAQLQRGRQVKQIWKEGGNFGDLWSDDGGESVLSTASLSVAKEGYTRGLPLEVPDYSQVQTYDHHAGEYEGNYEGTYVGGYGSDDAYRSYYQDHAAFPTYLSGH